MLKFTLYPKWSPVRIIWAAWCGLWAILWFLVGMFTFWPALFTLLPFSILLGGVVCLERVPQAAPAAAAGEASQQVMQQKAE